jgi:hypothetical protein
MNIVVKSIKGIRKEYKLFLNMMILVNWTFFEKRVCVQSENIGNIWKDSGDSTRI